MEGGEKGSSRAHTLAQKWKPISASSGWVGFAHLLVAGRNERRRRKKRKSSSCRLIAAIVLDVVDIACGDCVGELVLGENN